LGSSEIIHKSVSIHVLNDMYLAAPLAIPMHIQVFYHVLCQDPRRHPTGILEDGEAQYVPRGHLEPYT
jgi:hypothetical protein